MTNTSYSESFNPHLPWSIESTAVPLHQCQNMFDSSYIISKSQNTHLTYKTLNATRQVNPLVTEYLKTRFELPNFELLDHIRHDLGSVDGQATIALGILVQELIRDEFEPGVYLDKHFVQSVAPSDLIPPLEPQLLSKCICINSPNCTCLTGNPASFACRRFYRCKMKFDTEAELDLHLMDHQMKGDRQNNANNLKNWQKVVNDRKSKGIKVSRYFICKNSLCNNIRFKTEAELNVHLMEHEMNHDKLELYTQDPQTQSSQTLQTIKNQGESKTSDPDFEARISNRATNTATQMGPSASSNSSKKDAKVMILGEEYQRVGQWSSDENEMLRKLVSEHGRKWGVVSAKLPGRNHQQCRKRYRQMIQNCIWE
jgi:hypothetical protein